MKTETYSNQVESVDAQLSPALEVVGSGDSHSEILVRLSRPLMNLGIEGSPVENAPHRLTWWIAGSRIRARLESNGEANLLRSLDAVLQLGFKRLSPTTQGKVHTGRMT